ncbi:phenylacetate-CoA oxygenase subunit PaaJ [soil metagenome]
MVSVVTSTSVSAAVDRAIRAIPDPEIPVISIDDLGIVRGIERVGKYVVVTITPTYSGCPAMGAITDAIRATSARHGLQAEVRTALSPAWTTDWISAGGREALRRFGIAPPGPAGGDAAVGGGLVGIGLSMRQVSCPQCGSDQTEELSRFSGTACKALRRCRSCAEPFEEFKAL